MRKLLLLIVLLIFVGSAYAFDCQPYCFSVSDAWLETCMMNGGKTFAQCTREASCKYYQCMKNCNGQPIPDEIVCEE